MRGANDDRHRRVCLHPSMEHAATREDEPVRSTGRVEHRQFQIAIKGRCDDRLPIGLNCIATTLGLSRLIHGTNPYSRRRIIQPNGTTFNSGKVRRTRRRESDSGQTQAPLLSWHVDRKRIRVDRDQIREREWAVSFGTHDRIIRSCGLCCGLARLAGEIGFPGPHSSERPPLQFGGLFWQA